jgi:hypothetical protein
VLPSPPDIYHIDDDHVSELRPSADLLLIPQVIYEHGERWWNDIDRRILMIRPPELWRYYQRINLVAKQETLGEGTYEFDLRSIFIHISK